MKIIHLTTSTSGGAGIATVRLHHALLECGVNSSILCLKSTWPFPRNVIQYTESNPLVKRLWYRLKRLIFKNSVQVYGSKAAMLSSQMEIFTLPYSNFKPEKHPSIISADIIHLHWVAGFIDYLSFFRSINKPVVWTFHDMNPFLGGVHYTGDLLNQTPELAKLEKKFQSEKRHSMMRRTIHPIYLSLWMKQKAKEYIYNEDGVVIYNCLDFDVFRYLPDSCYRSVFNIPKNKVVFLFVAERIENKRKGFQQFVNLISKYQQSEAYFVALGDADASVAEANPWIQFVEPIRDERLLNLLYNSVDYLVITSLEDNLPNTMLEALACGCPVISSSNGGMNEHILQGVNGWLYSTFEELSEVLDVAIKNRNVFDSQSIRNQAELKFSKATISSQMKKLYETLAGT